MDRHPGRIPIDMNDLQYASLADSLEPLGLKHGEFTEEEESSPSSSGSRRTKKRGVKRQEKPPFSYIALIAMAIHQRPDKKATLAEIYTYLQEQYDFFRGDYVGWRNSIRHNLSLNDCFVKLPKDTGERGRKGHKWTIAENCDFLYDDGAFRRRPRGYKARKKPGFPIYNAVEYGLNQDYNKLMESNQQNSVVAPLSSAASMCMPTLNALQMPYPTYMNNLSGWGNYEQWYGQTAEAQIPANFYYPTDTMASSSSSGVPSIPYEDWSRTDPQQLQYSLYHQMGEIPMLPGVGEMSSMQGIGEMTPLTLNIDGSGLLDQEHKALDVGDNIFHIGNVKQEIFGNIQM